MTALNANVMMIIAINSEYRLSIGNTSLAYNSIYYFLVFFEVFTQ